METVPEEEMKEWMACKADFEREVERFNATKEEVAAARTTAAQQVAALESDLNQVIQKRERLQGRRTRVNEQYERIISANAQGLNERERRAAEQFAREQDHSKMESNFHEQFASISQSVQEFQLRTSQLWQQASTLEQSIQVQQQQMLLEPGPLTPEGNLPGTNPPFETSGPSLNALMSSAPNSRSLLGLSFPPARSSPLQLSSSPTYELLSNSTSPPQDVPILSQFPTSPVKNTGSYFRTDLDTRDRSFSNRSTHSSQQGTDFLDSNRMPPLQIDLSELIAETKSRPSPDGFLHGGGRPILSPFHRAASRGSGSGSGGSGSGSGSPQSYRG